MRPVPTIGTPKAELDTPILCVELDKLEANIRSLAEKCRSRNVAWRPHTKCHKSPALARQLIAAGAMGVTCAKLGEAEVMGAGGIRDILIANLVVGARKMQRLVALRRIADPIVCVDHPHHVQELGQAMSAAGLKLRVLIEVDLGMNRVGVQPGEPACTLARQVAATAGLELAGFMGYEGHLLLVADPDDKRSQIQAAIGRLVATRQQCETLGLACPIVSCGGTGSYMVTLDCPGITEFQGGGVIFMDRFYRERCHVSEFEQAMTIVATVVSRPTPERAIIDAGRKTMNMEHALPYIPGREDIEVVSLSAEHGILRLAPSAQDLAIGQRLELVPGYSDFTAVLHNHLIGLRDGKVAALYELAGRGRVD